MRAWHIDLAGFACIAALTGAGWLAGVQQEFNRRARAAAAQAAASALEDDAAKAVDRARSLRQTIDSANALLAADHFAPRPKDRLNDVLAQITALAEQCALSIDSLSPGQTRTHPLFEIVDLRLTARGQFPDLQRFLHRLHEDQPDLSVRGFVLTGDPARPDNPLGLQIDVAWNAIKPSAQPRNPDGRAASASPAAPASTP